MDPRKSISSPTETSGVIVVLETNEGAYFSSVWDVWGHVSAHLTRGDAVDGGRGPAGQAGSMAMAGEWAGLGVLAEPQAPWRRATPSRPACYLGWEASTDMISPLRV
jgi:hypothetical protein